jgi:Glu-tRNA(Gln) amidotransferase subunit E-like FAD-binding protein
LRRAAAAQAKPSDNEQVEAVLADVVEKPADVVQEQGDEVVSVVSEDAVEDLVEPAKRRGLFGLLQPVQGVP